MVSIFVRSSSNGKWTPLPLELLKFVLSFVTPIARHLVSKDYLDTLRCTFSQFMPWSLRRNELPLQVAYKRSVSLEISYEKVNVHQCMVFVAESTIPSAGYGLFLRPFDRVPPCFSNKQYFVGMQTSCYQKVHRILWKNTDYAIGVQLGSSKNMLMEALSMVITLVDL